MDSQLTSRLKLKVSAQDASTEEFDSHDNHPKLLPKSGGFVLSWAIRGQGRTVKFKG